MLFLLRQIRRKMIANNKFGVYLAYAVGELFLVVLGILIAIQIDDWNRDNELNQQELESYQLIITDLKRDSSLLLTYQSNYTQYLDVYYRLNDIKEGKGSFEKSLPDFLVSNIQYNLVTKNNHQATIEKLRNSNIREQINIYFSRLEQLDQAAEEFNDFIKLETRPFFLKENEVFNNAVVFDQEDRTFPPIRKISTIDTVKLKRVIDHPYFLPILSQLRMSIGFYLAVLNRSIADNNKLIRDLEKSLKN